MATPEQQLDREREQHRGLLIPFFWSLGDHRYHWTSNGRPVSLRQIRDWTDTAIANTKQWALSRTQTLIDGRITFETWITELRGELKAMHTGLSEIAIGGSQQWGAVEAGRLGARLRQQYDYLGRLGREVESGFQRLDGTLLNRVGLFVEAGRGTYEQMRRGLMRDIGLTEEQRVLHPAHHCADCPSLAGEWAPIGTLPAIGDTPCLTNCTCTMEFR